jgi:hypothetical protein
MSMYLNFISVTLMSQQNESQTLDWAETNTLTYCVIEVITQKRL